MINHHFDFNDIDNKLKNKLVKASVIPRPIAWISTLNKDDSVNLAPFSFFTVISKNYLGVSITRKSKSSKDTYNNIIREKEAVVNIPDVSHPKLLNITSRELPENESELILAGLSPIASQLIKTPGVSDVKIRFEVILDQVVPIMVPDTDRHESDFLILKIVGVSVSDDVYDVENQYILHEKLKPISRLGGIEYATIDILENK